MRLVDSFDAMTSWCDADHIENCKFRHHAEKARKDHVTWMVATRHRLKASGIHISDV
jgi:hypothetical protein